MEDLLLEEVWKPIPNFPNYEASSLGRIRSITHSTVQNNPYGNKQICTYKGKILNQLPHYGKSPYLSVNLAGKRRSVHRLVCSAFHQNIENKRCVNHIDGNKQNNKADNLEWVTDSENHIKAYEIGLQKSMITEAQKKRWENCKIENIKYHKQKQLQIICNETGELFENTRDCAIKLNIDRRSIMRQLKHTPFKRYYIDKNGNKHTYITYVSNVGGYTFRYAS